tara:strand:- start:109 stop:567 length:459 start_codon:yes stop_codon:yes gene_type:complete
MTNLKWTFPREDVFFMKIETVTISIIGGIIFLFSLLQTKSLVFAVFSTIFFFGLYTSIAYLSRIIFLMEQKYHLSPTHLEITTKNRFSTKKEKVHLKKIHTQKLDDFFLGGYVLSNRGKYQLYFNDKKELNKFVKHMKKKGKIKNYSQLAAR